MDRCARICAHLLAVPASATPKEGDKDDTFAKNDFLRVDLLCGVEDIKVRRKAREFAENQMAPIIDAFAEAAKFPFELLPKLGALGFVGGYLKGYGCPGMTALQAGLVAMEFARVSADIGTFHSILLVISMMPIYKCGNEEQKQKYLPAMARLEKIGCFCLTEPEAGSDASGLKCRAKKVDGGWILNGEKRWIGNGTFADVCIVWARNEDTGQVNGFIVEPKNTAPGSWASTAIEGKIGVRAIQNAHIVMTSCFVPDSQRLPLAKDFQSGPGQCLFFTRLIASFLAVGVAQGSLDKAKAYVTKRNQFGKPLAKLQLVQDRLVKMTANVESMFLMSWRCALLYDQDKLTFGQVGLVKASNTSRGREVVAMARELLGGNGMVASFGVARAFTDMEAIHSFEGTHDINTLIAGRELTGLSAVKP